MPRRAVVPSRSRFSGGIVSGGGGGGSVMNFVTEPTGPEWITVSDYDCAGYPGWSDNPSPYQSGPYKRWRFGDTGQAPYDNETDILTDATAPKPTGNWGNKVMRIIFRTNLGAGSGPVDFQLDFDPAERLPQLWIGAIMRIPGEGLVPGHGFDPDPPPGGKQGIKHWWASPFPVGNPNTGHIYGGFHNGGTSGHRMIPNWAQQGSAPLVDRNMQSSTDVESMIAGSQWFRYENYLKTNTADGAANGIARININASQVLNETDIVINSLTAVNPGRGFQLIHLNQTFGGGGGSPAYDQYMDYSFLRVKVAP